MPITLNAVGATLDVTIIDENFETVQDLFRQGILTADVTGSFDRFKIKKFTGGKLVAMNTFARPLAQPELANTDTAFDITYRRGDEDSADTVTAEAQVEAANRSVYAMELLGKPGPSFHYQWTEDGLAPPTHATAGWPPSNWPINRYPKELCFSKWLTVPFASVRVWVDEPCVARVHVMCKGSLNLFRNLMNNEMYSSYPGESNHNKRFANFGRFGIVVDTNPVLYTDEFTNTNPNIVDPITGVQAPYVSWKIIKDRTFYLPQRAQIQLTAEVALKGRRYYNFAMKFRDAAHHGYVAYLIDGSKTFYSSNWESSAAPVLNTPTWDAGWVAAIVPLGGEKYSFYPPFINLWENTSVNVEFFYGRDEAYVKDSTNAEFTSKPT